MNQANEISGTEAIHRMRLLKKVPGAHFTLIHLTCNLRKRTTGGMRKVERCRLRASMRSDQAETDPDHYLPYEDLDTEEPRQCFKKLIRYVGFPPTYKLQRVNWFTNEEE